MSETEPPSEPTAAFPRSTNPELFTVIPRLGGYVKIKSSEEDEIREPDELTFEQNIESRNFRVNLALDDDTFSISDGDGPKPLFKDGMYMLGTTISTLIMLAAGTEASTAHFEWTRKYLDSVRDDYGNHPPNVQGILNHMERTSPRKDEQTVRTTTRSKIVVP